MIKKVLISVLFIILLCIAFAVNTVHASDITESSTILLNDSEISSKVTDDSESTSLEVSDTDEIKISSESTITGLYIMYEVESQTGTIEANGKKIKIGENGFLHEYINISEKITNVKELTIKYDAPVDVTDIYVLDAGELPEYVEVWEKPCEKADIMLMSSHADDEQLFFLGLLPTYVAKGAAVQVVYFTYHGDQPIRYHEQLHGLYTVGVRHYPIIGIVPDAFSETLNGAISNMENAGISEEDALRFKVEMIRRFKPQVIVGHDEKGEYSHGQHILNTYLLEQAIELAKDETYDAESFNKYGSWNVLKVYLHLYEENPITMDYDIPLDYFDGKTAYEVSKEGYSKHNTQQWTWFTKWINGNNNSYTSAAEIDKYSPLEFGLYYSSIDKEDVNKDDFLENIVYYSEQDRLAKQKQEEEEAAKRKQEQELEKQKAEQEEKEAANKVDNTIDYKLFIPVIVMIVAFVIVFIIRSKLKND